MAGQEIYHDHKAMAQAKKKIRACKLVFTTCIGAGLGLLRSEKFEIVIVDEASQQTEPASLVPLVKGCEKAILVGDHVQLRPTVQQCAMAVDFDVSLFERLNVGPLQSAPDGHSQPREDPSISRLMLDTQYRMHPEICEFSSGEFYEGRLKTGISETSRPLLPSQFPWPRVGKSQRRTIFIDSAAKEAPGQKSKTNEGQASLCAHICKQLITPMVATGSSEDDAAWKAQTIAILTPYARQADLLKSLTSALSANVEVSSVDGFQGREADVVIFVTVRCNEHCEIGFLKDLRRMNVALTRAKAGLIVIGNRATLTEGTSDPESTEVWKRLLGSLMPVTIEV